MPIVRSRKKPILIPSRAVSEHHLSLEALGVLCHLANTETSASQIWAELVRTNGADKMQCILAELIQAGYIHKKGETFELVLFSNNDDDNAPHNAVCLLYTSPSPRD